MELSRVAPQFSGNQQRDAQELLTFLLDSLHLDLSIFSEETEDEKYDVSSLEIKLLTTYFSGTNVKTNSPLTSCIYKNVSILLRSIIFDFGT